MTNDRIDPVRRMLLRRLGLTATVMYAAPVLTAMGAARASGASSPSAPSRPSGPSRPSSPSRPPSAQLSGPSPARRDALPEIVLFAPAAVSVAPAEQAGYRIIDARNTDALSGRLYRIGLPAGRTPAEARAELGVLMPGALADQNHLYRPDEFLCSSDGCAAHEMIEWPGPAAGKTIVARIGMIDTGVNADHEALLGQRLTIHQTKPADMDAASRQHGTAIAAALIGRTDSRTPGLLPGSELIAVEAFHREGAGDAADAFSLVAAMDLLLDANVGVINLSFSGPANDVLREMTARAMERGVGMVAAAGNGGPGAAPAFPAAWPHVVAVTAIDRSMTVWRQANQGPYVTFSAPGVQLWTAASVSGGRLRSGTSYAAPFVTAALAVERALAPDEPLEAAIDRLIACARDLGPDGHDPAYGHGLVSLSWRCD